MRWMAALIFACLFSLSLPQTSARLKNILLVPLDNRPAAGQFAQLIGRMAGVEVKMPPPELLGRFTSPGEPDAILSWLERQDFSEFDTLIVSTDMICYGGLIASRVNETTAEEATQRMLRLARLRSIAPSLRIYAMTSIMRLAPTSVKTNTSWRMNLARFAELRDLYRRSGQASLLPRVKNLRALIPEGEIEKYDATRLRNIGITQSIIRMANDGAFDYLILGQDDARAAGPHVPETKKLRALAQELNLTSRVYFCEGIDQHANVLLSRGLLKMRDWLPKVRIVYSDPAQQKKFAAYESKSIEDSLSDQLTGSGASASSTEEYDYTLYVNVPKRRPEEFARFVENLTSEIDQGFPVAVADINLGNDGTADPELYKALTDKGRLFKLLSYAGWNTAGNTMGTAIPAANVYLFARRFQVDPLKRELAQREFLLHRIVNDFDYHKFTRPKAYALIDSLPDATREETYGEDFEAVDTLVRSDLRQYLDEAFRTEFEGKRFFAGTRSYEIMGLINVRIFLPWPRAYEVRLEFNLRASPTIGGN